MKAVKLASAFTILMASLLAATASGQSDPGVRGGAAGAGQPLPSVAANNPITSLDFFNDGLGRFSEVDSVSGTIEAGVGLGPRFNSRSCAFCHAQPAVGGTSPFTNPQVTDSSADGARNTIPSFITSNGPVREARFPFFFNSNGSPNTNAPNGGVEDLFTITGRSDAGTCSLPQPSFALAQSTNNIIFRIPTPVFGAGLVENIDDSTLLANQSAQASNNLGVSGTFNHNGNDGTISRFGWKAQNKSLVIFAGEAYNVEQGVSNEAFTQERPLPGEDQTTGLPANCRINPTPEDHTNFNTTALGTSSDLIGFALFMRMLNQPTASTTTPGGSASISRGRSLFSAIGCATCHTASLTTSPSSITSSLNNATANLFSDIEIHHMGTGLADNVSQGGAGGDQFRSAPLWGLGQRIFFLHDGRTSNLLTAIEAHQSNGSEATQVEENFDSLSPSQQQDLLNFLRSL
ncbi:MAG TPA: di-heme oxidoredictase family protein [Candidatus Dormibacteraeota bacterium]|nr:di-heme oxidoredictase family protein [Candidatus Dormibacteraeota bacterium]